MDNVWCEFIIYGFYYIEVCSFYVCFLEFFFFIINGCWMLSKAFSASVEIITWFLSFKLLICCFTLIDLHILKNPCIPGIKPTRSWCRNFLICCWILLARILHWSFSIHASDGSLRFCISSWFSYWRLYLSKNLSISSKLSILLAYSCWQSLKILCISMLSVVIFQFSFIILLIWFISLFFLMSLANNGFSILFIFAKNQQLIDQPVLLIFDIGLFVSFSFISALIFMISFPLLMLGFFISFFFFFIVALGAKLRYLFYFSLVPWGELVLLWTFPLVLLLLNPINFGWLCFLLFLFIF